MIKILTHSIDVDECVNATNPCHTNARCNNTDGTYTCTCNNGYYGNGTHCTGNIICISIKKTQKYIWFIEKHIYNKSFHIHTDEIKIW